MPAFFLLFLQRAQWVPTLSSHTCEAVQHKADVSSPATLQNFLLSCLIPDSVDEPNHNLKKSVVLDGNWTNHFKVYANR